MQKILATMMAFAAMTTQAQNVVDLTKWEDTTLCLDDMIEHVDTIILQKESVKVQSVQYANILLNDSVMMFGTTDGALFSIKDGKMIRPFSEPSFGVAQFSGEPAVHPGSALLDSHGKYCYAWGNAIVGGGRINFIKKMDFCTGEVVDSIEVNSADFSLSRDDSLRVAVNHDFLTCFPEYKFTLPENGRIARIRFYGSSKMWMKLFRKGKIEDYICNADGMEVKRVERLTYQGQDIDPNSVIGFARDKLASAVGTDTDFIIYVYHLKSE